MTKYNTLRQTKLMRRQKSIRNEHRVLYLCVRSTSVSTNLRENGYEPKMTHITLSEGDTLYMPAMYMHRHA